MLSIVWWFLPEYQLSSLIFFCLLLSSLQLNGLSSLFLGEQMCLCAFCLHDYRSQSLLLHLTISPVLLRSSYSQFSLQSLPLSLSLFPSMHNAHKNICVLFIQHCCKLQRYTHIDLQSFVYELQLTLNVHINTKRATDMIRADSLFDQSNVLFCLQFPENHRYDRAPKNIIQSSAWQTKCFFEWAKYRSSAD